MSLERALRLRIIMSAAGTKERPKDNIRRNLPSWTDIPKGKKIKWRK